MDDPSCNKPCESTPATCGPVPEVGEAVQVITTGEDHIFELNVEALEAVLLQKSVRDRNVVIVSVAGAFRKGKSFLIDFFIRYLRAQGSSEWLGAEDTPLTGFSWRGGCERDTTGILFWSEVFIVALPYGEQVAVLLMDTQGAFDSESTVKDCATVFALSTMLSSVQIFNLSQNIQEDDLQHLQLFTEYGRLALENSGDKPFQKLMFLVRDWSFPYEAEYGLEGGEKMLNRRLQISGNQHPELQQLRKHIRSCFTSIEGFLLPHPGLKVATNPKFDGRLSEIEQNFKDQLGVLVPLMLSPGKLVVKKINGKQVNGRELVEYFKAYVKIFQSDVLPEPKSMLHATAEANNLAAVAQSKDYYTSTMELICGGDRPYMSTKRLEDEHLRVKDKTLLLFRNARKMGGDEFSRSYEQRLDTETEEAFCNYLKFNESKNVFKAFRTPAVLFTVVVIAYVFSSIFGAVGLYLFANLLNLCMGMALFLLCLWGYVRYSGDLREVGIQIDILANLMWENVLKPCYVKIITSGLIPPEDGSTSPFIEDVSHARTDGVSQISSPPSPQRRAANATTKTKVT